MPEYYNPDVSDVLEWSRRTVADGRWLNDNTIVPIKHHLSGIYDKLENMEPLTVDDELSTTSENPVQNKVITNKINSLGQPLQWKSPATVSDLNAGISGIQPGWMYKLTDSGTLYDGDLEVAENDMVFWDGNAWVQLSVGNTITVDDEFSTTSENPVQNKVITNAINSLGKPLQWKGPATVSDLNAGISGIQPGWTYTLTDAGTLEDGSITVDNGDEVAWTENNTWFKLGGEGGIKIFSAIFSSGAWQYPSISEINAAIHTCRKDCLSI